jgi:tetratricopeptide (TPR) repeat protein
LPLIIVPLIIVVLLSAPVQNALRGLSGEGGRGTEGAPHVNFLEFLGGARQFLSYMLYIKLDRIHHGYYGALERESELIPYYYVISFLDPQYVDSYYIGGEIIFLQGREEEAINFTLRGIANNPQSADLYASLADLYLRQQRYAEAIDAYREALGRKGKIVSRYFIYMGLVAANSAARNWEGALEAAYQVRGELLLAFVRSDLDEESRVKIVSKINDLSNTIHDLEQKAGI